MRRPINSEELSIYYQAIGQAIYHLQRVEEFLVNLYFIKAIAINPLNASKPEVQAEFAKLHRKTLGQLIGLIDRKDIIPLEFLQKLKSFNKNRKWIVHNSARESGHMLYTDIGREQVIIRIKEFTQTAFELQDLILEEINKYLLIQGISLDKVEEDAKARIKRLRGE